MQQNTITVEISDTNIKIHVRENPRSTRLSMKFHPIDNCVYLIKPPHVHQKDVGLFIEKSRGWLSKIFQKTSLDTAFAIGNSIPVLGEMHVISYGFAEKPKVTQSNGCLLVEGFDPIIVPGMIKDWLRNHIYQYLSETSRKFAKIHGKEVGVISIKETTSRWGSCSRAGNLNYSWRLVFAPLSVAEYLCAHEVSHLVEMNHSPNFWKLVAKLCPMYKSEKVWLKTHGKDLFKYGS